MAREDGFSIKRDIFGYLPEKYMGGFRTAATDIVDSDRSSPGLVGSYTVTMEGHEYTLDVHVEKSPKWRIWKEYSHRVIVDGENELSVPLSDVETLENILRAAVYQKHTVKHGVGLDKKARKKLGELL